MHILGGGRSTTSTRITDLITRIEGGVSDVWTVPVTKEIKCNYVHTGKKKKKKNGYQSKENERDKLTPSQ